MRNSAVTVTLSGVIEKPYMEVEFVNEKGVIFEMRLKISSNYYFINVITTKENLVNNIKKYIIPENKGKELVVIGDLIPNIKDLGSVISLSKIIFADWFISSDDVEKEKSKRIDLSDTDDFFNEGKDID